MSDIRLERGKTKEMKVLELHDKGFSSRQIARLAHVSLREVTKYIRRFFNKTKSPSSTSVMDEVVLEYRISGMKHELRDLNIERDNVTNEVKELCAEYHNLLNQVHTKKLELEVVKRELETEKFFKEISEDDLADGF